MTTTTRAVTGEDIEDVLAFWKTATEATVTNDPRSLDRLITHPDGSLLIAEEDGQILGTIIAGFDGWRGNLYRMAVAPSRRRSGIATQLVAEAEAWLHARGAQRVRGIVTEDDPVAAGFWRSVGYEPDPGNRQFVKNL